MQRPKHHHHHSAQERKQAFVYLKQGKTNKETALLCGVSVSTIKNWKRTAALRGKDYQKAKRPPYTKYSDELKCCAVKEYLSGKDATATAVLFGILNPASITVWSRDERFRGGISLEEEIRPEKNYEKRRAIKPIEEMTPEEELEFLRMENAILKKLAALRTERQQPKRK